MKLYGGGISAGEADEVWWCVKCGEKAVKARER